MKKIIILSVLFLSLQSFAQKTVIVNNLSAFPVTINAVNTIGNNNAPYPSFRSETPATILIPAGQSRTMSSPTNSVTQFPYNSVASPMQYTVWRRFSAQNLSTLPLLNQVMISANGQKFNFLEITVGVLNFKVGTGLNGSSSTLFPANSGQNFTVSYTQNTITATNVQYIVQIN